MPLEISEIGVFVSVGGASTADHRGRSGEDHDPMTPERVEEIVRECIHDVLRTLRMREER